MRDRLPPRQRARAGRGQSELVGFLLIFSVAIIVIIVVLVTGFTGLETAQDYQRTANAEQGFTALAHDIDDILYHGAPSRITDIRLADAKLSLVESESIRVLNGSGVELARVETQPIVYDSGDGTTLTYYSGALVRADDGESVMFRDPDFVVEENGTVLPLVRTVPDGVAAVGGRTDAGVLARQAGTDRVVSNETISGSLRLNMSTAHPGAWERYFERVDDATVLDAGDRRVVVSIDTDRLWIVEKRVSVSLR